MTLHNPEGQFKPNPIQENNARYIEQLPEHLTVGIYHTDTSGLLTYANSGFCQFIGLDWPQLAGQPVQSFVDAGYQAQYVQQVETLVTAFCADASTHKVAEQAKEIHLEQQYVRPDGQRCWATVVLSIASSSTLLSTADHPLPDGQQRAHQITPGIANVLVMVLPKRQRVETYSDFELHRSEERFAKAFHLNPDAISISALSDGRYIDINDSFLQMFGYQRDQVVGRTCFELNIWSHAADADDIRQLLMANRVIRSHEYQCRTQAGRQILVLYSAELITLDNEPCILAFRKDITEYRRTERLMVQQAERDRLLTQMTQRIRQSLDLDEILNTAVLEIRQILKTDRVIVYCIPDQGDGEVIFESVDPCWPSMMGQVIADPAGMADQSVLATDSNELYEDELESLGSELPELEYTHLLERFDVQSNLVIPIFAGDISWGFLEVHHCSARRQWQPWEVNLLTQLSDQLSIAIQQSQLYMKLREANHELQRIALLDGLTRIANRRCFNTQLEQEWRRSAREQQPISLLLCDIDYFKPYNDHYGHPAGDQCLIDVAQALVRASRRPADLVARYGGEEFAVILPNTNQAGAVRVAQAMKSQVKQLDIPHKFSKISSRLTMSMGIATIVPQPNSSYEPLIKAADEALYAAKLQGRDRISCYRWQQETNALTPE